MSDCVDSDDAITKVRMLEPRPPPAWSRQDTVDQAMTGLLSSVTLAKSRHRTVIIFLLSSAENHSVMNTLSFISRLFQRVQCAPS